MDTKSNTPLDKRAFETLWARQLAYNYLSDDDYQSWLSFRSVDKVYLSIGDCLVNWTHLAGRNEIVKRFKLCEVLCAADGMTYVFEDVELGKDHEVDHVPQPLADSAVFAWIPHFNEVRHQPDNWEQAEVPAKFTVGICVWQRSNPTKGLAEHHKYLTTEKHFLQNWADRSQHPGA